MKPCRESHFVSLIGMSPSVISAFALNVSAFSIQHSSRASPPPPCARSRLLFCGGKQKADRQKGRTQKHILFYKLCMLSHIGSSSTCKMRARKQPRFRFQARAPRPLREGAPAPRGGRQEPVRRYDSVAASIMLQYRIPGVCLSLRATAYSTAF